MNEHIHLHPEITPDPQSCAGSGPPREEETQSLFQTFFFPESDPPPDQAPGRTPEDEFDWDSPEPEEEDPPPRQDGPDPKLERRLHDMETVLLSVCRGLRRLSQELEDWKRSASPRRRVGHRAAGPTAFFRGAGAALVLLPLLVLGAVLFWKLLGFLSWVSGLPMIAVLSGLVLLTVGVLLFCAAAPLAVLYLQLLTAPEDEDDADF